MSQDEARARIEDVAAAADHLLHAEAALRCAIDAGVAEVLDDGPFWRLVLSTVVHARQFVADSAEALRQSQEPKDG